LFPRGPTWILSVVCVDVVIVVVIILTIEWKRCSPFLERLEVAGEASADPQHGRLYIARVPGHHDLDG
jgi:hypothetical protein